MASIDELSKDDESDDRSIIMNALKGIRDRSKIHLNINARDARLTIRHRIIETQN